MKCDDFPRCAHGSPLVCLTARAAETPEDEHDFWLNADELTELERRYGQ